MRLIGSFLLALLVALALFGLMLALVTPPERAQMPERELVRIGVTRSVADSRNEHQPQQLTPMLDIVFIMLIFFIVTSSLVMRCSHSSSTSAGRALRAGNEPTTPALHWAMTRSGLEMINSGEQMTGRLRLPCSTVGRLMVRFLVVVIGRL